jgi:hypothetical protein
VLSFTAGNEGKAMLQRLPHVTMMMKPKPRRVLLSASLLVVLSAPALAADPALPGKLMVDKERQYPYVGETSAPAQRQGPVRAGGVDWQCSGARCTGRGPSATPGVRTCKALAQQVGVLKAYGHAKQRLGANELAQCNGAAAAAAPMEAKHARQKPLATAPNIAPLAGQSPGAAAQRVVPPLAAKADVPAKQPAPTRAQPAPVRNAMSAPLPRPDGFGPQPKQGRIGAPQAMLPAVSTDNKKGGFAPAVQSKAGTGSPLPPKDEKQAAAPADKSAATRTLGPVSFTTETFTITGTGTLNARASFSPRSFTTDALTVTGTGALTARLPFAPRSFSTEPLTVTGTGALR